MSQQLPAALLASLQTVKGFDEAAFTKVHQSGEQVISIRFNPAKKSDINNSAFNIAEKIPWSSAGFYLDQRPSFTSDPLFHAGVYYVQEASSMFLEEAIRQTCDLLKPLRVLDLCAAPGGKSTLIQSIISADSLLVSNEVIKTRVNILSENITKWGSSNVVVTNNDPGDFKQLENFFDVIVVDAPCSGSGLFRKDPSAIDEWSLNNVELCSQRQQRILATILPALKPGGMLIYSTCSYSEDEDEVIADWLLSGTEHSLSGIKLELKNEWNIVETVSEKCNAFGYRFYPDKLRGEGFFIAAFKKNEDDSFIISKENNNYRAKNKPLPAAKEEITIISPFLKNANDCSYIKWMDEILAVPSSILHDILFIQSVLYIKKLGIKMGSIIRNELIPDHELALCTILSDNIPAIEIDLAKSLQYLRRHDINAATTLKGWALIKYNNQPLGWVKILPNRINNYYPKSWRILNK